MIRALALDRGGLLVAVILALYVAIAPEFVVGGDNAELATAGTIGGVPHPSGYPLYMLWLRAMAWLPGTAAHATALATALLGASALLVMHAACRAWGARPLAASIAVAIFAAAPAVIDVSTHAEVFALNNLVVATVVWLSAREAPLRGTKRAVVLALVAGLGLANHMTCVLVAPVGVLGFVRGVREANAPVRVIAASAGAFVVGLLPYAYLFVTNETALTWRSIDSFGDLVHHVLRMDYGGPGAFAPNHDAVPIGDSLAAYVLMLGRSWLWLPLAIGLAALFARVRDWSYAMLALCFVVAGPLLVARFDVAPSGIGLAIVHRFHLLSALLLVVPVAAGIEWLLERTKKKLPRALEFAAPLVFGAFALRSLPAYSPAVERCASNLLRSLPEGAVVIVSEDDLYFGTAYLQLVESERTDVVVIAWAQLLNPEYRRRLELRTGITAQIPADKKASVTVADDVLMRGKPLFADFVQINILKTFPTVPHGIVLRVLPRGAPQPPIGEVFETNKAIYQAYRLDYPVPDRSEPYAMHVHDRYARTWGVIARALGAAGMREQAGVALEMARALEPVK